MMLTFLLIKQLKPRTLSQILKDTFEVILGFMLIYSRLCNEIICYYTSLVFIILLVVQILRQGKLYFNSFLAQNVVQATYKGFIGNDEWRFATLVIEITVYTCFETKTNSQNSFCGEDA